MKKLLSILFLLSIILISLNFISAQSDIYSCNSNSDCNIHPCSKNCVNNNYDTKGMLCALHPRDLPESCTCENNLCVNNKKTNNSNLVGNDKDEYGCIGSAGYSWCEEKQKCLRVWEENCSDIPKCVLIGTRSEGWEYKGKNEWARCSGCIAICDAIDSDSEGWYSKCNDSEPSQLISLANCKNIKNKIKILPETASQRARERLGELGFNITLKEVPNCMGKDLPCTNKNIYEAKAEKEVKILGFIKTKAKLSAEIDAETGDVNNIKRPWWSFLASGF